MSASAGDHVFKEARVTIHPGPQGAAVSLFLRRRRGLALEWQRHLGWLHVPWAAGPAWDTTAGALRAAGDCLHAAADRLDAQGD